LEFLSEFERGRGGKRTMKWEKASEELKAFLGKAMAGIDCENRLMFGYPAYFIRKHLQGSGC